MGRRVRRETHSNDDEERRHVVQVVIVPIYGTVRDETYHDNTEGYQTSRPEITQEK